ncbi:extensin family protein [Enterobacter hormaechei]|uniref:extensin-like domain-containing protein n=1 Tax=Enterobacter hormaechei TaxID=158836 RepID=UPI0005F93934|nr:extensin family protein [Enterobacter hormaechei]KJX22476.1 extensin [Enterobacter hormaechei subsp. xiangfangensis]KUQ98339.1 extensin [Enterobacter hormaechei subsp. xiangfangensis]KZP65190.1 extensin [Enterobacter hormaechei subsp. xiangfangensis]MCM8332748.1 extensin family protein [Enterobacter hormaechei]MCM8346203.1 extensin family protein [Enterobacter hormaechei]
MKGKGLFILIVIAGIVTVGYRWLPSQYNPFVPLTLDDPPGKITHFKLRHLTPQACESLLTQANQRRLIRTQAVADSAGECPLSNVVRVRDFGPVSLNSSFLASCPLALSSALFVSQQARPLTKTWTGSELARIEHLGSFACRNIYSRPDARRSEHATADALDISAFRLANGQRVTVLNGWKAEKMQPWLQALLSASCGYYGNSLGPDYNAAHANHFHLGMRGYGLCR